MFAERKTRTLKGHTWVTGEKAPVIPGWEPYWVSHFGMEKTVFTYRPIKSK